MKKNGFLARFGLLLTLIFMYAPILVLIVFSFNSTKSRTVWTGFSLHWYADLFSDSRILSSLATTIEVAVLATIFATILGTAAAIGFSNLRRRTRGVVMAVNNIPLTNADIITGVSLMMLFVAAVGAFNLTLGSLFGLKLHMGFGTLLLAHITFDVPYVILSIMPRINQLDPNLYDAALDLGATPWYAFRRVVLQELRPGIFSGAMLAFTMSVDDFVVSYFTAGSGTSTLAMEVYSMTRKRISPEINALSTLIFVIVLIVLVLVNVQSYRQDKARQAREKLWKQAV